MSLSRLIYLIPMFFLGQNVLYAQDEPRAQVMVLGSYHMHNPGADVFNVEADDVLVQKRQAEIRDIVDALKEFNPTMVCLEKKSMTARDTQCQFDFQSFRSNDFELSAWEGHQIGFRIAKELGHNRIYNIDEPGDFPFQAMMEYAQKNSQTEWIDRTMAEMEAMMKTEQSTQAEQTIGEILVGMNEPRRIAEGHQIYVAGCQIGAPADFIGADVLTGWYTRNAHIFSNMYHITEGRSDERILVIFGAGHAHILRELVKSAPEFDLIEPNHYLQSSNATRSWKTFRKHLDAVENKDTLALKETLDIAGDQYHLILPDGSQLETAQDFYKMHQEWFGQEGWTMEMQILNFIEDGDHASAFVQADYREADRNGKPYHHKMWITYMLKHLESGWKIVHDHASTAEKTE